MKLPKKKILICGATGFIGRNLVEELSQRDDLDIIAVYHNRMLFDHPRVRWVQADLTSASDVERVMKDVDILIQAAATTSGSKDILARPYIHVTDNAVMNSLLFRAAFEQHIEHVIFFSCTIMYPSSENALVETDFDACRELFPNYFGAGWTKIYLEKMCEFYSRFGRNRFTVIRHSNIYGPYDKFDLERSHVFGATITKVLTAQDGRILVWGSGEERRDLLYVDDLVDFVGKVIDRIAPPPFSLYNVGAGQAISIKDLVARIVTLSGRPLHIEHDLSKPTIKTSLFLDCHKAKVELDWEPRIGLDEGIRRTIHWWLEHYGT